MTKIPNKTTELSLAVQYGVVDPQLPRWRLRRWVNAALLAAQKQGTKTVANLVLTIRLVDQAEGRELNRTYRNKDYATNVLTFDYEPAPAQPNHVMADVVICTPVLRQEAKSQGKPYLHHAVHLVVHGTLHALGYDHTSDKQATQMEALEVDILKRWGIKDPYNR